MSRNVPTLTRVPVSNRSMQIVLDFPKPIAEALQRAASRSGDEVIDLVVEAIRSSDLVQRALADSYPCDLTKQLLAEVPHG